ncbi:aromatic acid exporter family protein [Corynebacterium sp.]|uniref:FUSC family protein n=1 Tax=Corynebacterium sp. TaxID=1720 RepID=UPI0026DDC614|nr:FUSC family protein [Corynebacterium sp.]MDO4610617.1 FUSC family protein [Corynebacterium sp.]
MARRRDGDGLDHLEALRHPASRAAAAVRRRTRPRTRFLTGVHRVRTRWLLILQAAVAAGLSYWFALDVLGHAQPFFAPMAAFIGLSVTTSGPRINNSIELVLGAALGVGIGDVIIGILGPGVWQLAAGVLVAMIVGVFTGRGPLVVNQAASSAVLIATIMPPGTGPTYERMIDALVGGIIGVLVMAVVPRNPVVESRRSIASVLELVADILYDVGRGLEERDGDRIRAALQIGRASQGDISAMVQAVGGGAEQARVSPMWWGRRRQLRTFARIVNPVDNAMRNARVLARRAITATEDHVEVSPKLISLVKGTASCAQMVRRLLDDSPVLPGVPAWGVAADRVSGVEADAVASGVARVGDGDGADGESGESGDGDGGGHLRGSVTQEEAIRALRVLASRMDAGVVEGAVLSEIVIFAQCRSIVVDLLQVCGLSRLSAVAALPPTTERPAMPPEVWDGDGGAPGRPRPSR